MLELSFADFLNVIDVFKKLKHISFIMLCMPVFEKYKSHTFKCHVYMRNRWKMSIVYHQDACGVIELGPINPNLGLDIEAIRQFYSIKEASEFIKLYAELPYQGIPLGVKK